MEVSTREAGVAEILSVISREMGTDDAVSERL